MTLHLNPRTNARGAINPKRPGDLDQPLGGSMFRGWRWICLPAILIPTQSIYKISTAFKLDQILQLATEEMRSQMGMDFCVVSRWDREINCLNILAVAAAPGSTIPPSWYDPYALQDYPLTAAVLKDGQPVECRIDDPALDPAEKAFMVGGGISTLLMLPLIVEDQIIGLIELMDAQAGRVFKERELSLVKLLALHIAAGYRTRPLVEGVGTARS